MNEGLGLVLLTLLSAIGLIAVFNVGAVLFPNAIRNTHRMAKVSPGRSLVFGLVNAFFLSAIILALGALGSGTGLPLFDVPAIVGATILVVMILFGLTAMVELVGERLVPDQRPARRMVWGSVTLIAACLTPFIGWFIIFPYITILGFGAFILAFVRRSGSSAEDLAED